MNSKNGIVTFGHAQIFEKDAELYVKFEEMDLSEIRRKGIDFVFLRKDGSIEQIDFKEIQI